MFSFDEYCKAASISPESELINYLQERVWPIVTKITRGYTQQSNNFRLWKEKQPIILQGEYTQLFEKWIKCVGNIELLLWVANYQYGKAIYSSGKNYETLYNTKIITANMLAGVSESKHFVEQYEKIKLLESELAKVLTQSIITEYNDHWMQIIELRLHGYLFAGYYDAMRHKQYSGSYQSIYQSILGS